MKQLLSPLNERTNNFVYDFTMINFDLQRITSFTTARAIITWQLGKLKQVLLYVAAGASKKLVQDFKPQTGEKIKNKN